VDTGSNQLNGAALDPATGTIYVSQARADGARPVIHAFKLSQGG
jgi:hypothetical protein